MDEHTCVTQLRIQHMALPESMRRDNDTCAFNPSLEPHESEALLTAKGVGASVQEKDITRGSAQARKLEHNQNSTGA